MTRLFLRLAAILVVCVLGILFATQSFGTIPQGASVGADSTVAVAPPVPVSWGGVSILLTGAVILLARPRRRALPETETEQ